MKNIELEFLQDLQSLLTKYDATIYSYMSDYEEDAVALSVQATDIEFKDINYIDETVIQEYKERQYGVKQSG